MSSRLVTVACAACCALVATAAGAAVPVLPRHPAPSPDGSEIAFSWQGDLWLVPAAGGRARQLTTHPASDRFPVWSRDGRLIAFASERAGNDDVFVIAADGSAPPRRLTFASQDDRPSDFSADGSEVLFTSRRFDSVRWMPGIYAVPVAGGTPHLALDATGHAPAYSPDGAALVFVRGETKQYRSFYRGAANRDLWLRTADGEERQLTEFDGDDDLPSWLDAHSVAFLSARSGRKNVFRLDLVTGQASPLSHHEDSDVRFPRAAADGSLVAYEYGDGIWTVDPAGTTPPRPLAIEVPADRVTDPVQRRTETADASDLAVSPDGALAVFVVRGDLFLTAVRSKEDQEIAPPPTIRLTSDPARDSQPSWAPDGGSLVFTTRRGGSADLYRLAPRDADAGWLDTLGFELTPLVATDAEESDGRLSPDGTHLAFVRGKGDVMVAAADGSDPRLVVAHWQTPEIRWSPDSRWLAYSLEDAFANSEIWIAAADGGRAPYNVSRHPDYDLEPAWSPDGRRLLWVSHRVGATMDVWGVWLRREDSERTPEQWLAVLPEPKGRPTPQPETASTTGDDTAKPAGGEPAATVPEVRIDFEDLWRRVEPVTSLAGDESEPLATPDGRRILFSADTDGDRDLYAVRFDGDGLERLTTGGAEPQDLQLADDTVFFLDGKGHVKRVGLAGKPGDPVPFQARLTIDLAADRAAIFDEAWRVLGDWFYDPELHGADWRAVRERYRPLAIAAPSADDFSDVMNMVAGELNGSHLGYYPKAPEGGEKTGWLGVTVDPAAGGPGLLVTEVLPDSPAARVDVGLTPGDRLLAVDGRAVGGDANLYAALVDTVGHRIALTIRDADGGERTVAVRPVAVREIEDLRYRQWVRQRQALVERWSGGRLGYVHIHSMDLPSFEEFERGLYAAADGKEGLLIDVRSNGGGWTTDYLMAVLTVRRHAWTVPRDADPDTRAYPTSERLPVAAWTRPAAALCNEESYSNAEIFSHAFKTLERGPLIGWPTFGAVISTGAHWLLDGARWRIPNRGWYVASSGENMEHHGAIPDVIVAQPPDEDYAADRDDQLQKAVEVLLADIATDPRAGSW